MGIFKFIKEAGVKIFGSGKEAKGVATKVAVEGDREDRNENCLLYTSPSPRD